MIDSFKHLFAGLRQVETNSTWCGVEDTQLLMMKYRFAVVLPDIYNASYRINDHLKVKHLSYISARFLMVNPH